MTLFDIFVLFVVERNQTKYNLLITINLFKHMKVFKQRKYF